MGNLTAFLKPPARGLSIGIHLASLVLLSLVAFNRNEHSLFLRWDGHLTLALMKTSFDWPSFGAALPNLLQGVGEFPFPALYDRIPAFVIGHFLAGDPINQPVSLTVLGAELFLATVFLGTTVKLSLRTCLIGAWLVCILFMPYMTPTPTYIRIWGNSPGVEGIAIAATAIALIVRTGRAPWRRALALGAATLALLAYLFTTQPVWALLATPVIGFFALVSLVAAGSRVAATKIVAVGAGIAIVLAAVFGRYFYGLYGFSVAAFFWSEFLPAEISLRYGSFFFHPHEEGKIAGRIYFFVALLGPILTLRFQDRASRPFALGYLLFVGLIWGTVAFVSVFFGGIWRGPPPAYFDMMVVPFQALFAAVAVDTVLTTAGKMINRPVGQNATASWIGIMFLAIVPWAVLLAKSEVVNGHWPWPPPATPLTKLLADNLAIAPGSQFRGRVVNLAGGHDPGAATPFFTAWHFDEVLRHRVGNEHRYMGLWFFNIPTFHLSSQFYSPFYHVVNMRLLNRPQTKNARPQTQTTEFVPRVMRSLGISWVLDDVSRSENGVEPVIHLESQGGRKLYAHRLDDANVGNWSPTRVLQVGDIRAALKALADPAVDLRNTAVAFEKVPRGLVPAKSDGMRIQADGLAIDAASAGFSLLLLPLEYSNCLEASVQTPHPADFRLLRLNVNLTGVLFRERASGTIRFRYGPFRNARCRIEDWKDAQALKLAETEGWWP